MEEQQLTQPYVICRTAPFDAANNMLYDNPNRHTAYSVTLFSEYANLSAERIAQMYENTAEQYNCVWLNTFYTHGNLQVTINDYIVDISIDAQLWDAASNIAGSIAPTELTITLLNTDNIFDPANSDSLYSPYVHMGNKLLVTCDYLNDMVAQPYMCITMQYYRASIVDVSVSDDASIVTITARTSVDGLLSIVEKNMPVFKHKAIDYILQAMAYRDIVFSFKSSTENVPALSWFDINNTTDGINQLINANMATLLDIEGNPTYLDMYSMLNTQAACTALLSDTNQICSIEKNNTLVNTHETVSVKYYNTVLTSDAEVLNCTIDASNAAPKDDTDFRPYAFSTAPIYALEHAVLQTENDLVPLVGYSYNAWELSIVANVPADKNVQLLAYATVVSQTEKEYRTEQYATIDNYTYDCKFIQSEEAAKYIYALIRSLLNAQRISMEIRGNQLLHPGLCVYVDSNKYNAHGVYLVSGVHTEYNGALSQKLELYPLMGCGAVKYMGPLYAYTCTDIPLSSAVLNYAEYVDGIIRCTADTIYTDMYCVQQYKFVTTLNVIDSDPDYVYAVRLCEPEAVLISKTPWHLTCTADELEQIILSNNQPAYDSVQLTTLNGSADTVHKYTKDSAGAGLLEESITGEAILLNVFYFYDLPDGVTLAKLHSASHDLYTVDNRRALVGSQKFCRLASTATNLTNPAYAKFTVHAGSTEQSTTVAFAWVLNIGSIHVDPDWPFVDVASLPYHISIAYADKQLDDYMLCTPIVLDTEEDIEITIPLGSYPDGFGELHKLVMFTLTDIGGDVK